MAVKSWISPEISGDYRRLKKQLVRNTVMESQVLVVGTNRRTRHPTIFDLTRNHRFGILGAKSFTTGRQPKLTQITLTLSFTMVKFGRRKNAGQDISVFARSDRTQIDDSIRNVFAPILAPRESKTPPVTWGNHSDDWTPMDAFFLRYAVGQTLCWFFM